VSRFNILFEGEDEESLNAVKGMALQHQRHLAQVRATRAAPRSALGCSSTTCLQHHTAGVSALVCAGFCLELLCWMLVRLHRCLAWCAFVQHLRIVKLRQLKWSWCQAQASQCAKRCSTSLSGAELVAGCHWQRLRCQAQALHCAHRCTQAGAVSTRVAMGQRPAAAHARCALAPLKQITACASAGCT